MMLTVDIPDKLKERLERDKKRLGLSRSDIVRAILQQHYESNAKLQVTKAA